MILFTISGITCVLLTDPTNGDATTYDMSSDVIGNYPFGTVASFSCMTGFGIVGIVTRTCGGDGSSVMGTFDGSTPTCECKNSQYCTVAILSDILSSH